MNAIREFRGQNRNTRDMIDKEQSAQEDAYMRAFHATPEELNAYNEYLVESVEEIYGDDANFEERFSIFVELLADENDNQGTNAGLL